MSNSSPTVASRDTTLSSVEAFLAETLPRLVPEPDDAPHRGRPVILPSLCLWSGLVVCVLRGFSSQLALWRLLASHGLWHYPRFGISDQAVYNRLEREGIRPMEDLFAGVSALLAERLAPYAATDLAPFATEVVAFDESTLEKLARRLPALRDLPATDAQLLGGKLAGVFDLRRQQWSHVRYIRDATENEKRHARDLLTPLPIGSLILADLGYFSFQWFDELTDGGYYWISRLRQKTSHRVIHTFYARGDTFDGLIELGAHRADRAKHAVRLVQFRVGTTLYRYLTNVRDPQTLPLREIARLYARRWDFELAVNTIKTHLGLHLLWSAKEVVIQQQMLAVLIIAQVLQALRLEIAGQAGVDPFEVSLPLLIQYLPQFAAQGVDPIAAFLEHARELRFIRPSSRTVIRAPTIPAHRITPLPPDLPLERIPRYAPRPRTLRTQHPSN
jgi:hypothetical protein